MYPNRVAAVAAAVLSLALGALPIVANADWQSTAGIVAAVGAVLTLTQSWLKGWQADEARKASGEAVTDAEEDTDVAPPPDSAATPDPLPE